MAWDVDLDMVKDWMLALDPATYVQVRAALDVLADHGPQLGRPLVDSVKRTRHKNMKELRPGSVGRTEVRMLFAFDPTRRAIFLLAGDKSGEWNAWYDKAVPKADEPLDAHLERLKRI
jgi:hypothetical protein